MNTFIKVYMKNNHKSSYVSIVLVSNLNTLNQEDVWEH